MALPAEPDPFYRGSPTIQTAEQFIIDLHGFDPFQLVQNCRARLELASYRDSIPTSQKRYTRSHLESTVRAMITEPELQFANIMHRADVSRETILPYIIPQIFSEFTDDHREQDPQIRTALVRDLLSYGVRDQFDMQYEPAAWIADQMMMEFNPSRVRRPQLILNAVIDSLLDPVRTDFDGMHATALTGKTFETNKQVFLQLLSRLDTATRSDDLRFEGRTGEFVETFVDGVFSRQSFSKYIEAMQKAIIGINRENLDDKAFILKYLSTGMYLLRNPEEFVGLSGFIRDYKGQGLEITCLVGKHIAACASSEWGAIPIADLLNIEYIQGDTQFIGIGESINRLKDKIAEKHIQMKVWSVTTDTGEQLIIKTTGKTGRRKYIFVPANDLSLTVAALEQSLFFWENDNFGPEEHIQIIGNLSLKNDVRVGGQVLGDYCFFSTVAAMQYGGTAIARMEHEIHERLHLEAFRRWPKLRKLVREPQVWEGLLYAYRNRVDAKLLPYIHTAKDRLPDIWLQPWNSELNGAKYSLAYLVWVYIGEQLEKQGSNLLEFFDAMERDADSGDFRSIFAQTTKNVRGNLERMETIGALDSGSFDICVIEALRHTPELFKKRLGRLEELFGGEKRREIEILLETIHENPQLYKNLLVKLLFNINTETAINSSAQIYPLRLSALAIPDLTRYVAVRAGDLQIGDIADTPVTPDKRMLDNTQIFNVHVEETLYDLSREVLLAGAISFVQNADLKVRLAEAKRKTDEDLAYLKRFPEIFTWDKGIKMREVKMKVRKVAQAINTTRRYITQWE